jgi:type II secretion system protein G
MGTRTAKRAFTLIEILIVVVILGILAAIVIPQFTDASQEAMESSVRSQLQTIRSQIELYNVQNPNTPFDAATPLATFFDPLVQGNYLQQTPKNPLQDNATTVGAGPAADQGWVWAEAVAGDAWTLNLYAVDEAAGWFVDDDGNPW